MEQLLVDDRDKMRRPVRNKRYNRKTYVEDKRTRKRLFTPEIKRFLKDWLVRRRDNPYPSRDEKKTLAIQTGLTYIQVCNWFANWRRKLKNAGKELDRKTWGLLIKTYNSQVQGNVEHFSICSDDSIWEEREVCSSKEISRIIDYNDGIFLNPNELKGNDKLHRNNNVLFLDYESNETNCFPQNPNKYKNHIMEKYLRDCHRPDNLPSEEVTKNEIMTKWLESAANFRPKENSYLSWTLKVEQKKTKRFSMHHGREELDAAEALTRLANAHTKLHTSNS